MKYVFASLEASILLVLALSLFSWAAHTVSLPNDFANIVGLVGGITGTAALLYVATKRARYYFS